MLHDYKVQPFKQLRLINTIMKSCVFAGKKLMQPKKRNYSSAKIPFVQRTILKPCSENLMGYLSEHNQTKKKKSKKQRSCPHKSKPSQARDKSKLSSGSCKENSEIVKCKPTLKPGKEAVLAQQIANREQFFGGLGEFSSSNFISARNSRKEKLVWLNKNIMKQDKSMILKHEKANVPVESFIEPSNVNVSPSVKHNQALSVFDSIPRHRKAKIFKQTSIKLISRHRKDNTSKSSCLEVKAQTAETAKQEYMSPNPSLTIPQTQLSKESAIKALYQQNSQLKQNLVDTSTKSRQAIESQQLEIKMLHQAKKQEMEAKQELIDSLQADFEASKQHNKKQLQHRNKVINSYVSTIGQRDALIQKLHEEVENKISEKQQLMQLVKVAQAANSELKDNLMKLGKELSESKQSLAHLAEKNKVLQNHLKKHETEKQYIKNSSQTVLNIVREELRQEVKQSDSHENRDSSG